MKLAKIALVFLAATAFADTAGVQPPRSSTKLVLHKLLTREIEPLESERFTLQADAGQFVHFIVRKKGIEVLIFVNGPRGERLLNVVSSGNNGVTPVSWVTGRAGSYTVEVMGKISREALPNAAYDIEWQILRTPTKQDLRRLQVERLLAEMASRLLGLDHRAGENKSELEYYTQALPLWREVGDGPMEAWTLFYLGFYYSNLGEKQKALDYYNQGFPICRHYKEDQAEMLTLNNMAFLYGSLGARRKSLEYLSQALVLEREKNDKSAEAATLNNMGEIYEELGETQKALEHLYQALPIWWALADQSGEAKTLSNIGSIYKDSGDLQEALKFFNQSLQITNATSNPSGEATTLNNIGLVDKALGDMQGAKKALSEALLIEHGLNNPSRNRGLEGMIMANLGGVYIALGEKPHALDLLNQAIAIFREVPDPEYEALTLKIIESMDTPIGNL